MFQLNQIKNEKCILLILDGKCLNFYIKWMSSSEGEDSPGYRRLPKNRMVSSPVMLKAWDTLLKDPVSWKVQSIFVCI